MGEVSGGWLEVAAADFAVESNRPAPYWTRTPQPAARTFPQ